MRSRRASSRARIRPRSRTTKWRATPSPAAAIPSASETSSTGPCRAITSCMFETVFSNSGSDGATTTTGTIRSTSAMGPCLSSPDA